MNKEWEAKIALVRDEAMALGRKQAEDEVALENRKLREVIESLRAEVSMKSKRLIELQFDSEEVLKAKKKLQSELEDAASKAGRERES